MLGEWAPHLSSIQDMRGRGDDCSATEANDGRIQRWGQR
jgi:hypothetical protein